MTAKLWMLAVLTLAPRLPTGLPAGPPQATGQQAGSQDMPFDHAHAAWTRILGRYVEGDRFDYKALGLERGPLDEYLLQLRGVQADDFATWTREQRYAFWLNAYNAFTVHLVLSRYPVRSIRDIATADETPWQREFVPLGHLVGGPEAQKLSLDDIERGILGVQFEDARAHVALHRATEGSPALLTEAFRADRLERQLDALARRWLADPRLNRFEREQRRVRVSAVLDWFEGDFVRDAGSVRSWLARYAPEQEREWLEDAGEVELDDLPYSWKLDDVERDES